MITHLYASRSGAVRIFGHDVARESGAALRCSASCSSSARSIPISRVEQNLAYHARPARHWRGAKRARARAIQLARVGLADRAGDKVRYLSGGQMRRVEIARALLHRPRMLLLDEPTAGLDIKARADILEVVRGLVADEGIGVLWATHLVDEIRDDDHVVVLHKGRVLADGPSRSIIGAARRAARSARRSRQLTGDSAGGGESVSERRPRRATAAVRLARNV